MPLAGSGLVDRFIASQHRRGLAHTTLERYADVLGRLDAHCGGIELAGREAVVAFLDSCSISPSSRSLYLTIVGVFFRWGIAEDRLALDPTVGIQRPRVPRGIPRPIADADLVKSLDLAGYRMRCWLLLGAYEGFRAKEIAGLRGEDVQPHSDPPVIIVSSGKGSHARVLPLHDDVLAALKDYGLPIRGPVWRRRDGRELTGHDVTKMVAYHFRRRAGVDATAHNLRHWFATRMYALTRDIRLVQELLGHQDPATTAIYTRVVPLAAAEVVRSLSVLP